MRQSMMACLALALSMGSPQEQPKAVEKGDGRERFNPRPLRDEWTDWLVGEWEGWGETDTGKGKGTTRVELALNGQFRLHKGEGVITEMTREQVQYLKRNMHASDEEIERFRNSPYRSLEIYTVDQDTGQTIGYLFDSLRCIATGRGTREGNKETMHWEWTNGHKSTRITERTSHDKMIAIQRTPMPDGSIMEERGEAIRRKAATSSRAW